MCHDDASRPPAPPGAGEVAEQRPLTLTAADGTQVLAHLAVPAQPSGVGMVVLPDVRGLHTYYRDLAARFAEVGMHSVAVDYFGRTADTDDRSDAFEFWPHVKAVTPAGVALDTAAAIALLRTEHAVTSVFTVGFCMGGGMSWRQSAEAPGLAGAIGFYGRPALASDAVDRMRAPLLMLVAGADAHIPAEEVHALAEAASAAGVEAEVVVYDGAPHSFFDRSFAEHTDTCADAWRQILTFVHRLS